jgi:hypothetical protein
MNKDKGLPYEGGSEEPNEITDEDILAKVEKTFYAPVDHETLSRHANDIHRFLVDLNINDASNATAEEVLYLWQKLHHSPPQVKDFVYTIIDVNTELNLGMYPVMPTIEDLIAYATDFSEPRLMLRNWFVENKVIPSLTRLGFKREDIVDTALADDEGKTRLAEVTRLVGWLAGQPFMSSLGPRLKEFKEDHNIDNLKLTHAATVAIILLRENIDMLQKKANFRDRFPMEKRAKESGAIADAIHSLEGIYNICDSLILGEPHQK